MKPAIGFVQFVLLFLNAVLVNSTNVSQNSILVFDAMPLTCQKDNWGMPYQSNPRPFNPYFDQEIRIPCQQQWSANLKPMSEILDHATVMWYKNNDDYDNLISTDWIPENRYRNICYSVQFVSFF